MAKDIITPEVFEKLVDLAAIGMDESQTEYLRKELCNQLTAIHLLMAIPLNDSVPVTVHGVEYSIDQCPELRQDKVESFQQTEDILKQAPSTEDNYIVMPDIPHTDLD
jgi:aspartyl/glutamyl-tRNA(Asn/Gln) amidotransferase C subunit